MSTQFQGTAMGALVGAVILGGIGCVTKSKHTNKMAIAGVVIGAVAGYFTAPKS